jgi:hypothetical protein
MTDNVTKFEPAFVSEAYRFDADETLDKAKGEPFVKLLVLGQLDDGSLYIMGNANAGESLILMEKVKHHIVFGED